MGIPGLLPLLKSIANPIHLSQYAQQRIGIDGFAWLHRGAHNCATELALQQPTDRHIAFCLSRLRLLVLNGITPVLVFDGGRLSSKFDTEADRGDRRVKERTAGIALLEAGEEVAANKCFQRCVTITANACRALQLACKEQLPNVECLFAPYEADAQLAYLTKIAYISAVISEDSDLLVFGATKVIYKLDSNGYGSEIALSSLAYCHELSLSSFTHEQFQCLCILAGCDYLPSLQGLGIKKSYALMRQCQSWQRALRKVKVEGKIKFVPQYEERFERALLCFKHQLVFDPTTCSLVHLTPVSEETKEKFDGQLDFLGRSLDNATATRVAKGEIHPETLTPYDVDAINLHRAVPVISTARVTADADMDMPTNTTHARSGTATAVTGRASVIDLLRQNSRIDAYFVSATKATSKQFIAPRTNRSAENANTNSAAVRHQRQQPRDPVSDRHHHSHARHRARHPQSQSKRRRISSDEDVMDTEELAAAPVVADYDAYLPPEIDAFAAVSSSQEVTYEDAADDDGYANDNDNDADYDSGNDYADGSVESDKENGHSDYDDRDNVIADDVPAVERNGILRGEHHRRPSPSPLPASTTPPSSRLILERRVRSTSAVQAQQLVAQVFESVSLTNTNAHGHAITNTDIFQQFRYRAQSPHVAVTRDTVDGTDESDHEAGSHSYRPAFYDFVSPASTPPRSERRVVYATAAT